MLIINNVDVCTAQLCKLFRHTKYVFICSEVNILIISLLYGQFIFNHCGLNVGEIKTFSDKTQTVRINFQDTYA